MFNQRLLHSRDSDRMFSQIQRIWTITQIDNGDGTTSYYPETSFYPGNLPECLISAYFTPGTPIACAPRSSGFGRSRKSTTETAQRATIRRPPSIPGICLKV